MKCPGPVLLPVLQGINRLGERQTANDPNGRTHPQNILVRQDRKILRERQANGRHSFDLVREAVEDSSRRI